MNYFKVFFYVWKRSFSEASYYKDVLRARFNFSLKYFLFFCFILSIITTIFIIVKELIPFNEFISTFPQELISIYPPELEIKINKGIATTNVPQPYFIPVSRFREAFDEVRKEIKGLQSDKIENILVIDTNATIDDMKKYQTYMLLTRNHLSSYKDNWNIETISLDNINNITINKNFVRKIVNPFIPIFKLFYFFAAPFIFTGLLIFFTISQLIYLLLIAFILFLGAKLISYPISYTKSYQIDLHLATIITPFFLLLSALRINVQFPFLRLIIFTVVGLFILHSLKTSSPLAKKVKIQNKRR